MVPAAQSIPRLLTQIYSLGRHPCSHARNGRKRNKCWQWAPVALGAEVGTDVAIGGPVVLLTVGAGVELNTVLGLVLATASAVGASALPGAGASVPTALTGLGVAADTTAGASVGDVNWGGLVASGFGCSRSAAEVGG